MGELGIYRFFSSYSPSSFTHARDRTICLMSIHDQTNLHSFATMALMISPAKAIIGIAAARIDQPYRRVLYRATLPMNGTNHTKPMPMSTGTIAFNPEAYESGPLSAANPRLTSIKNAYKKNVGVSSNASRISAVLSLTLFLDVFAGICTFRIRCRFLKSIMRIASCA